MGGGSSKSVTVGYKYYVGMQHALCHGPTDKLVGIYVGDKLAWTGANAGGRHEITAENLFGGEKLEGGVAGAVDVSMGGPTEPANAYLASKLGAVLPAFRGVMCAILNQIYIGLNPYLKDWGWMVQRIHTRSQGEMQWLDYLAAINEYTVKLTQAAQPPKTVFLVEPNSRGWAYVHDPDFSKTSADIPGFGQTTLPLVGAEPPNPESPNDPTLPDGKVFSSGAGGIWNGGGFGQYTVIPEANHTGCRWIAKSFQLVDLSPVYISHRSDDSAILYVDDVEWEGQLSYVNPTKLTMKVSLQHNNPGFDWYYAYANIAVWQVIDSNGGIGTPGTFSDMNPAHIIRECLTDTTWGMGYTALDLDDEAFEVAANILYDEAMGISLLWNQQTSINEFVSEILRHIDGALYIDHKTGKFVLKLIRDPDVGSIEDGGAIVLFGGNILEVESYTKTTIAELINTVTVSYDSHETGQVETVTVQNLARIQEQGITIPATIEYMGFSNQATARKAALRDLRALSSQVVMATITANRTASILNIGDVFWWAWIETDEEGTEITTQYLMRVVSLSFGDGVENAIRIEAVQDIFSTPTFSYVEDIPTEWEYPLAYALPAYPRIAMEAPYYEIVRRLGAVDADAKLSGLPDLGLLFVAAGRQGQELDAEINTNAGTETYTDGDKLNFCPYASLAEGISYLDTTVGITNMVDFDIPFVGGVLAQIDNEIVVVESIASNVATLRRGCLDTVPMPHLLGAKLIVWDGFAEGDEIEYVASEAVGVRLRTGTGESVLSLVEAPEDVVVMRSRAIAPYPPANVKVNDAYFPETIELETTLTLTWVHRDRVQQTGGILLGWTDGSVGPEAGTTYNARLVKHPTGEELDSVTLVSGVTTDLTSTYTGMVRVEVWAVRGGKESYQRVNHIFEHLVVNLVDDAGTTTKIATTSGNVLTNDEATGTLVVTAVNGVPANVGVVVAVQSGGNFTINADGTWLFDPAGDFNYLTGAATALTSITYTASDGISSSTATLSITVTAS